MNRSITSTHLPEPRSIPIAKFDGRELKPMSEPGFISFEQRTGGICAVVQRSVNGRTACERAQTKRPGGTGG
jgi:hypothetical protein